MLKNDSVIVYKASSIAASGTQAAVDKAIEDLKSNKTKVFDTSKFTVGGQKLTSYKADVDTDENFEKDTEAISDGYFHESELRSAPYFDIIIDGIDSTIEEEEEEEEEEGGNNNGTINFYRKEKNKLSTGVILAILIPCAVVLIAATIIGVILSRRASAPVSDPSESTIQAMKI